VLRFIVQRKEQGRSSYTINSEVAHLSHLFTWVGKPRASGSSSG
jgi:hypothetical protein